MNDLISINYEKEQPTVSGRDLHAGLEITTPYHIWFPRMCEYGFRQEKDYSLVEHFCTTNNPRNPLTTRTDHNLSISMHKAWVLREEGQSFDALRIQALTTCSGLVDLWENPFCAVYLARDGQVLVRLRWDGTQSEIVVDTLSDEKK